MKFKPNGSWVVLPDPTITETESGIIKSDIMLQEEASKRDGHAKVVAVSQEVGSVKVGDTVIPKGQGFAVMIKDIEYFQMNMFDVLGVLR